MAKEITSQPTHLVDKDLRIAYNKFIQAWEPLYRRNMQDGYPQLNSFQYILHTYPHFSQQLRDAANAMVLSGYKEPRVKHFIELYKQPCRNTRLSAQAERLDLHKSGKESQRTITREQRRLKEEKLKEGARDRVNPNRKNSKQKELKKNSNDRELSQVNPQQSIL